MWMRRIWVFSGFTARLFKWSKDFSTTTESSVTPVWLKFPQLPLQFFAKETLFSMASAVGAPLKVDRASGAATKLLRPSEARVCVELDVVKERPSRLWIGTKERGRWQPIEVEDLPEYCLFCRKMGHSKAQCKQLNKDPNLEIENKGKMRWIQIGNSNNLNSTPTANQQSRAVELMEEAPQLNPTSKRPNLLDTSHAEPIVDLEGRISGSKVEAAAVESSSVQLKEKSKQPRELMNISPTGASTTTAVEGAEGEQQLQLITSVSNPNLKEPSVVILPQDSRKEKAIEECRQQNLEGEAGLENAGNLSLEPENEAAPPGKEIGHHDETGLQEELTAKGGEQWQLPNQAEDPPTSADAGEDSGEQCQQDYQTGKKPQLAEASLQETPNSSQVSKVVDEANTLTLDATHSPGPSTVIDNSAGENNKANELESLISPQLLQLWRRSRPHDCLNRDDVLGGKKLRERNPTICYSEDLTRLGKLLLGMFEWLK